MKNVMFALILFVFGCAVTPKIPVGFTVKQELHDGRPTDKMTPELLDCKMVKIDYSRSIKDVGKGYKESYVTPESYQTKKGEVMKPRHEGIVEKKICRLAFDWGESAPKSSSKIRDRIKRGEYFLSSDDGNFLVYGDGNFLPGDLWEMDAMINAWNIHPDKRECIAALATPEDKIQDPLQENNWITEVPIILQGPESRVLTIKGWYSQWFSTGTPLIAVVVHDDTK